MRLFSWIFCILAFNSVATADPSRPEIKLGVILALTGDAAPQNNAFLEGIELALQEINLAGGIRSRRVALTVEDSQLLPKNSNTAAHKLLSINQVDGVILGSIVEAVASGPAFEGAKIPALVLWDSSTEIENIGEYVFSVGIWSESSGWAAAEYALTQGKKAAILSGLEPWSETLAHGFAEKFKAGGGEVVIDQRVDINTTDFRTPIARIRAQHSQILYAPFCYNLIPLFRQLKNARLEKVQIVTSDCIADDHLREAPGLFDDVIETAPSISNSPTFQLLLSSYQAETGRTPAYPFFVALGYDATKLFASAWVNAGTGGPQVKDWLYHMPPFVGAGGNISFNERGTSAKRPGLFKVTKDRLQPLE